jgi:hypothetical protein
LRHPELGWDESDDSISSQFHWMGKERHQSINFKELGTPLPCLKAILRDRPALLRPGDHIAGELDNSTAVSYLNKQGGSFEKMSLLAERTWRWLLRKGLWHSAEHLAGVLNVQADTKSRWRGDRSEWRLTPSAWREVERAFGPHSVDLFASRTNHLCDKYFSRFNEPGSAGRDALRFNWAEEANPYANPPYALLPKIIAHVRHCRCDLTVVAPVWPARPWLAQLLELSVEPPRLLLSKPLLESTMVSKWTQSQPVWSTAVWRISGRGSPRGTTILELHNSLSSSGAATG